MEPIELKGFYYQHERENGQLDYKIVSPQELGRYVVHSPVDNELLEKWQSAIDKQIRLYSYSRCWGRSKYYHYLRLTDESRHLLLQLPPYPKNIEELQIIRLWLIQLFKCFFEQAKLTLASINPQMIKLLFDNDKTISTKFQTERAMTTSDIPLLTDTFKNNILILGSLEIQCDHHSFAQYDVLFHLFTTVRIPCVFLNHAMDFTISDVSLYKLIMKVRFCLQNIF
uniref:Uncharacterized protein n=1 Tax=Meloidogyne incognita TaxID=6306 RepID=A0A914M9B5_MELIC